MAMGFFLSTRLKRERFGVHMGMSPVSHGQGGMAFFVHFLQKMASRHAIEVGNKEEESIAIS
jgi:hypothetical protein